MIYHGLTPIFCPCNLFTSSRETRPELGIRQLRLATGKRINSAGDDPSGFAIASRLESRVRGQAQALANIADAKSMLTVAEDSLDTIQEILVTMKEKVIQGANDTLATADRSVLDASIDSLFCRNQFNCQWIDL